MIRVALVEDYLPQIQRMEEILNQIQHDEKLNLQITCFQDGETFPPYLRILLTWRYWISKCKMDGMRLLLRSESKMRI